MPLIKGSKARSKKGVSANISKSMHEGRPQKQSIAIAMTVAGKGKGGKKKSVKKSTRGSSHDRMVNAQIKKNRDTKRSKR